MNVRELRNLDDARRWLLEGAWLLRAVPVEPQRLKSALEWALEIASSGSPLPPLGVVADVAHVVLESGPADAAQPSSAVLPAGLAREYEDYVLGRLYADLTVQRAADALLRYQGRDRTRALAFLIEQLSQKTGLGGVLLSPALIKSLQEENPAELLSEGWESIQSQGLLPLLVEQYGEIVAAIRNSGDLLEAEDVFELERGTALAQFGQRLALRQVLHAAGEMAAGLPRHRPRLRSRSHQVATHLADEDSYPVGGFSSVSNRGSIESLLHSQLTYMEPDDRPDLFDIKFVRDELLYYSRDENQFLRRRRTFLFALSPELVEARFKDASLPYQRIVMLLALLLTAVRKLIEWLSDEALVFEFLFLDWEEPVLEPEKTLVEMLLSEQIANGSAAVARIAPAELDERCRRASRRSLCHCLQVATSGAEMVLEHGVSASLRIRAAVPELTLDGELLTPDETATAADAWTAVVQSLLRCWLGAE